MPDVAIGLTVIDEAGNLHVRCWYPPPHMAGIFAEALTSAYGAPDEMFSDVKTMGAGGQRAAAEGGAVFLIGAGDD